MDCDATVWAPTSRASAVHTGLLSSNPKVDLASADALVARVLRAILARGRFPDWSVITIGDTF